MCAKVIAHSDLLSARCVCVHICDCMCEKYVFAENMWKCDGAVAVHTHLAGSKMPGAVCTAQRLALGQAFVCVCVCALICAKNMRKDAGKLRLAHGQVCTLSFSCTYARSRFYKTVYVF